MALVINTNVASLEAQRNLVGTHAMLGKSFQRLSSGYRINSAADDAAGLAISENMRAQVRSYSVAERNTMNAVSMAQVAEAGLGQVSSILIRMRELAVQASNGDLTTSDRNFLDQEFDQLKSEITRLTQSTKFNGKDVLGSATVTIDFQIGIENSNTARLTVLFGGVNITGMGIGTAVISGAGATAANSAISAVDAALTVISTQRADYGATINRLEHSISNLRSVRTNMSAANSRIRDVDVAEESAALARNQVLSQAGTAMLAQANQAPQMALSLLQ